MKSFLYKLNVSNLNTSNITYLNSAFYNCFTNKIDLSSWDTSKVTNMSNMFYFSIGRSENYPLAEIIFGDKFTTENVINFNYMFYVDGNSDIKSLDLSKFGTNKAQSMISMFNGLSSLVDLKLPDNFVTSYCTDINFMFMGCSSLPNIDMSTWDFTNMTTIARLFANCSSMTNINLSNVNAKKITNVGSMFYGCTKLVTIDLSGIDFSSVTTWDMWGEHMFTNCTALTTVYVKSSSDKTLIDARLLESGLSITSTVKS